MNFLEHSHFVKVKASVKSGIWLGASGLSL
jgi:hypothetical protein